MTFFVYACTANMSKDALYPLDSSSYTRWDEKIYDVPCTIPGAAGAVDLSDNCLVGFTRPYFKKTAEKRINCVQVMTPQPLCLKWLLWFPRIRPLRQVFFFCLCYP
jgi:hypothetical protein